MLYPLFTVESVIFTILGIVTGLFFFWAVDNDDSPSFTIVGLIVFFCAWLFLGDLGVILRDHYWKALIYPAIYVAIGFVLSFPFWILFLRKAVKTYNEEKAYFMSAPVREWVEQKQVNHTATIEDWYKSGSFASLRSRFGFGFDQEQKTVMPPLFASNRQRLVAWVTLWPWKALWTFCRDIVVHGIKNLVNLFGGTYQRISNWIGQGIQ